jgi:hypothetical protein
LKHIKLAIISLQLNNYLIEKKIFFVCSLHSGLPHQPDGGKLYPFDFFDLIAFNVRRLRKKEKKRKKCNTAIKSATYQPTTNRSFVVKP